MHAFFDTNSTQPVISSPESLPMAFVQSDMFTSAVVSDSLKSGKFAGLGVYGGSVPRDQRPPTWNRGRLRLPGFEGGEGGFP